MSGRRPRSGRGSGERRSAILSAAAELLVERGYRGTSMRAIAEAAEIDTASLYHYFASKDELVFELVSHMYAERLDEALADETGTDPVERIRRFSRRHFLGLAERFEAVAIAYRDDTHLTPPHRRELQQERARYVASFRELIEDGRRSGAVAADVVPELAAVGLLGMAFVLCEQVAARGEAARGAAADAYTAMVVRSLVGGGEA